MPAVVVQLIGIGGTIGTALYVSIGRGLMNGGPASLFIAFTIWYAPLGWPDFHCRADRYWERWLES